MVGELHVGVAAVINALLRLRRFAAAVPVNEEEVAFGELQVFVLRNRFYVLPERVFLGRRSKGHNY